MLEQALEQEQAPEPRALAAMCANGLWGRQQGGGRGSIRSWPRSKCDTALEAAACRRTQRDAWWLPPSPRFRPASLLTVVSFGVAAGAGAGVGAAGLGAGAGAGFDGAGCATWYVTARCSMVRGQKVDKGVPGWLRKGLSDVEA